MLQFKWGDYIFILLRTHLFNAFEGEMNPSVATQKMMSRPKPSFFSQTDIFSRAVLTNKMNYY